MTRAVRAAAIVVALALAVSPATAKKKNLNIDLAYTPTEEVAATEVSVSKQLSDIALALAVSDERNVDSAEDLGIRTDGDDREHQLVATSDVIEFVTGALVEQAEDWDLNLTEGEAALALAITVERLEVLETNQAVGATYEAWVELDVTLRDSAGNDLWTGGAAGDATRYGRKFSNDNINEVLSDALSEAFGAVVDDNDFDDAVTEAAAG